MKKSLIVLFSIVLISCTNQSKKNINKVHPNISKTKEVSAAKKAVESNNEEEKKYNGILKSIENFKISPTDSLEIGFDIKPFEKFKFKDNQIEIFKKDSSNIDWIKINGNKILIDKLKIINSRTDKGNEDMFCNNFRKLKLYKYQNETIIFMMFESSPCTGLGCSVTDYLIYNVTKKKINLFGSFRSANLDFYQFPINSELSFIATDYKGDFHEAPISFKSRIYSMKKDGSFKLLKDKKGNEYFYEVTSLSDNQNSDFEYKFNWF